MKDFEKITYEEFKNNKMVKFAEKYMKKKYPWVTRLDADHPNEINQYRAIFVRVFVDPFKLVEWTGLEKSEYFEFFLDRGERGLEILLQDPFHYIFTIVKFPDEDYDQGGNFNEKINDALEELSISDIIPDEYRLPKDRYLLFGKYQIDPNTL
jgi:hypothetical protein